MFCLVVASSNPMFIDRAHISIYAPVHGERLPRAVQRHTEFQTETTFGYRPLYLHLSSSKHYAFE